MSFWSSVIDAYRRARLACSLPTDRGPKAADIQEMVTAWKLTRGWAKRSARGRGRIAEMAADYTQQLNQIAAALNRSGPPAWQNPWILAAFASLLGVIGGFIGQILLLKYTAMMKLKTMRRMVYADIVELFAVVDAALNFPFDKAATPEEAELSRQAHFKLIAPRMSEDYIKANPEVFAKMPERIPAEGVYSLYHHLLLEPEQFDGYLVR